MNTLCPGCGRGPRAYSLVGDQAAPVVQVLLPDRAGGVTARVYVCFECAPSITHDDLFRALQVVMGR